MFDAMLPLMRSGFEMKKHIIEDPKHGWSADVWPMFSPNIVQFCSRVFEKYVYKFLTEKRAEKTFSIINNSVVHCTARLCWNWTHWCNVAVRRLKRNPRKTTMYHHGAIITDITVRTIQSAEMHLQWTRGGFTWSPIAYDYNLQGGWQISRGSTSLSPIQTMHCYKEHCRLQQHSRTSGERVQQGRSTCRSLVGWNRYHGRSQAWARRGHWNVGKCFCASNVV